MSIILTDKLSVYASIPYFLRTRDTTIYKSLEIAYAGNFCGTLIAIVSITTVTAFSLHVSSTKRQLLGQLVMLTWSNNLVR